MNWIDRTISYFSPRAGYARARYRALSQVALAYDGAKTGRRTDGWLTTGKSANAEIRADLPKLRERSRDLIRNNHFAAKAAMEFASKVIGTGITARTPEQNIATLWARWCRECSADNLPHFGAVQQLVAREVFESGEVLIRKRTRTASVGAGMSVPIQLQILEPDFIDAGRNGPIDGGGWITQGIEFNSWGNVVAYWLFPQHPGDDLQSMTRANGQSSRVDAREIIHVFERLRSQVRGVPHLAPVMLAMRDLDDWEDAELVRKRTEACLAAVVTSPEDMALGAQSTTTSASSVPLITEEIHPGMVTRISPGEDIKFNTPSYAGGYAEYKKSRVKDIAAGAGMIYEILSGDLSDVNYSSYRAGLLGFRDRIEQLQWNVFIPAFYAVWDWFIEAAIDYRGLPAGDYPAEWQTPAFDLLDREAEAKGDMLMLQAGTMTWPQAVQRQGYDPEAQLSEIETWKPRLDGAGIEFSSKGAAANGNNPTTAPAA